MDKLIEIAELKKEQSRNVFWNFFKTGAMSVSDFSYFEDMALFRDNELEEFVEQRTISKKDMALLRDGELEKFIEQRAIDDGLSLSLKLNTLRKAHAEYKELLGDEKYKELMGDTKMCENVYILHELPVWKLGEDAKEEMDK